MAIADAISNLHVTRQHALQPVALDHLALSKPAQSRHCTTDQKASNFGPTGLGQKWPKRICYCPESEVQEALRTLRLQTRCQSGSHSKIDRLRRCQSHRLARGKRTTRPPILGTPKVVTNGMPSTTPLKDSCGSNRTMDRLATPCPFSLLPKAGAWVKRRLVAGVAQLVEHVIRK
jgi:hypothetical protein